MNAPRDLGPQPRMPKTRTAGSSGSQQPLAGRPSKSQRVAARWIFESRLVKAALAMRLAVQPRMSTSTPCLFLRTAEVAR
jgi:hypothetical protein